ncbi:MAG: hypothetical protein HY432_01125 [Candidatus Liptonbacteria bacterium]|nr:hypothetical protein [Candidatus Liptonbacteria bacterium]
MRNRFFLPTLYVILFLSASFFPLDSEALTVGPAKMEFSLDPGNIIEGKLFLMNEGSEARTLYPSFEKFAEVNGAKQFLPGERTDLSSWLKIDGGVYLEAGESKDVPFTLTVPEDAPPGGHFAVIWWGTSPPNTQGGQGTAIITRAGILVYLNVSGEIQETAEIGTFDTREGNRLFSRIPEDFNVVFKNTGNVYLKPGGEIRIKNMLGITTAVLSVNKFGAEILPRSQKEIRVAPESVGWKGFGFGYYTADLSLNYGDNMDKQVGAKVGVFVITWQIILPIILVLFLIFWISTKGIKKYNKRVIEKYMRMGNKE